MTTKGTIKELPVAEIEATAATQVRVKKPEDKLVKEYAEAMSAGSIFPPIAVFAETGSKRYLLADGFTRLESTKQIKCETITCLVRKGGVREALEFALGANDDHGQRRTNKDKRNAVKLALKDPEWCKWSNADIGRLCKVDDKTVLKVREDMVLRGEIDKQETVKTRRGGKVVEQKAKQSSSEIRTKSGETQEKQQDRKTKKGPKTQLDKDLEDTYLAIEAIKGIAMSGADLVERSGSFEFKKDFEYCRDWFDEAAKACDAKAA